MGQRMPPVPHIYGDDCLACFDAGKTPKYMYVRFSQVQKCVWANPPFPRTPPNDRVFKLTQSPITPCLFIYDGADWTVDLFFNWGAPAKSVLLLADSLGMAYFEGYGPACIDEGEVFYNLQACIWPDFGARYGFATVTWTQQATELLEAINMERADDLFMEMWPLVDGNLVYKFCRRKDATNIAIEFEPD